MTGHAHLILNAIQVLFFLTFEIEIFKYAYRLSKSISLFDLVGLEIELSEKLGIKVDLVTEGAVHPKLKSYINQDLKVILEWEKTICWEVVDNILPGLRDRISNIIEQN